MAKKKKKQNQRDIPMYDFKPGDKIQLRDWISETPMQNNMRDDIVEMMDEWGFPEDHIYTVIDSYPNGDLWLHQMGKFRLNQMLFEPVIEGEEKSEN